MNKRNKITILMNWYDFPEESSMLELNLTYKYYLKKIIIYKSIILTYLTMHFHQGQRKYNLQYGSAFLLIQLFELIQQMSPNVGFQRVLPSF